MTTAEIKTFIGEFLQKLNIVFDGIEVVNDPATKKPRFIVKSKDSKLIIGSRGENLQAINLLIKQAIRKKSTEDEETANFLIDVNNYYGKRIDDVLYQAKITAERVRMFKRDIELLPMNAYERLLVHSYFSDDSVITTESQGEGKFRKIVLKYCASDVLKATTTI